VFPDVEPLVVAPLAVDDVADEPLVLEPVLDPPEPVPDGPSSRGATPSDAQLASTTIPQIIERNGPRIFEPLRALRCGQPIDGMARRCPSGAVN
jgi:hypothetical protein